MTALPQEPGIHYIEDRNHGSRLTLSIPDGCRKNAPRGLVVALHYGGPVTPFYGAGFLEGIIEPGLSKLEAVIAAPDCEDGIWHSEKSEKQICDLIENLRSFYGVPTKKTLLTGYSIGGIGSWYIAGRNQSLFSAAMPIAAKPPEEVVEWAWSISVHIIHGLMDELFPIDLVQSKVSVLLEKGADISLAEVPEAGHFQMGCYVNPIRQAVPWILDCWS